MNRPGILPADEWDAITPVSFRGGAIVIPLVAFNTTWEYHAFPTEDRGIRRLRIQRKEPTMFVFGFLRQRAPLPLLSECR